MRLALISVDDAEVDALRAVLKRDSTCRPVHAGLVHLLSLSPSQGDVLLGFLRRIEDLAGQQPALDGGRNPPDARIDTEALLQGPVTQLDRDRASNSNDAGSTPAGTTEDDACDTRDWSGAADLPQS